MYSAQRRHGCAAAGIQALGRMTLAEVNIPVAVPPLSFACGARSAGAAAGCCSDRFRLYRLGRAAGRLAAGGLGPISRVAE
jgi:hypothetical protein